MQQRLGVHERMERVGRHVLRNIMPDQHRSFYAGLPFLVLGTRDAEAQPWASVVTGRPGFVSTPDASTLRVAGAAQRHDPLAANLALGADIGVLGIEFATRRRNRANGLVAALGENGFDIAVRQSFGNCPKYIQARSWSLIDAAEHALGPVVHATALSAEGRALVARADTFFVASALGSLRDQPNEGIDASHRGGKPGFVRIDDERTLTVPDFLGNSYYNTLGNLLHNPRCGLLFIDFDTGTTLQLAAEAEIVWDGAEVEAFAGAERLVRFRIRASVLVERALPLRWHFGDYSPFLAPLGAWPAG